MQSSQNLKAELRKNVRAVLAGMAPSDRTSHSDAACRLLERQAIWATAKTILFYAPMREELDIWPLLVDSVAAGKTVSLPRFDPATNRYLACEIRDAAKDVATGQFGIREPGERCVAVPLNRLDLILVPGVAFDLRGGRLGRGNGFYDRLLAEVRGATCGVAFDEQIVEEIPVEPHDIHLNCILTPTRWVDVTRDR
jgi:5-formyltetrahydrofolate cyclo-ligase